MLWTDDCQTAEDVWAKARVVMDRKRRALAPIKRMEKIEPLPPLPVSPTENPLSQSPPNHSGIEKRGEAESSPLKSTKIKTLLMLVRDHRNYWFTWEDIRGRRQSRAFSYPRQEMMWLMHKGLNWSLPTIGRTINRDHTTVLHGIRGIDDRRQRDLTLRERLDAALMTIRDMMEKEHPDEQS